MKDFNAHWSNIRYGVIFLAALVMVACQSVDAASSANSVSLDQVTLNPTGISFGSVPVGHTQTHTMTLTNSSGSKVTISQATVTSTGFSLSGLSSSLTLAAGQSVTLNVNFAPSSIGVDSGIVSLVVSGRQRWNTATLNAPISGTGTEALPPAPTITTSSLPGTMVGTAYSATLSASGGTPPYEWGLASGQLPPGLALASSSGVISGTPATAGSSTFIVQATDGASATAKAGYTLSVALDPLPLQITTLTLPGGAVGTAYSATLTASGGTAPYTWTLASGSLPPGSTLSSSGLISGTPSATATSYFFVQVKDSAASPQAATSSFSISIAPSAGGLATNCTLYAAANGVDTNDGHTPTTPKTLRGASSATVPGSVVCIKGGTYNFNTTFIPAHNGTSSAWIVYKAYGDSPANFVWTGGTAYNFFGMENHTTSSFSSSSFQYLEFDGLNLDGQNGVGSGFKCHWGHHMRFVGNYIKNMGSAGISTHFCDYITSDSNKVYHSGYNQGWSSGISYNGHPYYDTYTGIHSYVVNNIISGEFDGSTNHTDGNGIIMDRANANNDTPPALILNNVVYENGGRCIESYLNSHHYYVNNTCYKNALDTNAIFPEAMVNNASNVQFINNLVYGVDSNHYGYMEGGTDTSITFHDNLYFHSKGLNFTLASGSNFISGQDPLFLNPPATALGGYSTALDPTLIADKLTLQLGSPAINAGIDPTTVPGLTANIISDLQNYVYKDINGNTRPQGGAFDLGAYQH